MRRHINIDGCSYTPEDIEVNREQVITVRDIALQQNEFGIAVSLSHTIALLAILKEEFTEARRLSGGDPNLEPLTKGMIP